MDNRTEGSPEAARKGGSPEAARNPQTQLPQDELALTTQGAPAVSSPGDNVITGGDFPNANFGPVTRHHKTTDIVYVTRIAKQETHHHYYGQEESSAANDEPSTSQERKRSDILELSGSIKIFKNQRLHQTKPIYKGEKTTARKPIPIAVKLMNHSKRALRETESLHILDFHPNVVRIYDSGMLYTDVKYIFVAMELCSPETLYDYVINMSDQSHNPRQAISHSTQIISGLEYIHNRGIAHRDLKPQNILFSASGGYDVVKISDFGLSKNYFISHSTTLAGAVGTLGYMAAEIIKDEKPINPTKCDIFSLGIVLVFRLSDGKHPYGEEDYDWTHNIASGKDPNLDDIHLPNKKQMNDIKRLISKMLQHSPENRPAARDLMKEWNKDVCGFIKETSRETPRARRVQDAASDQEHREETAMHGYSLKMDDYDDDVSISDSFSADISPNGGEILFDKCHITFPEKCFAKVTRTEGKLEVAPHKCPSQYIPITPMLYLESSNSPKEPISVKLASWCVNDGSDEGKAVKVHVLHLPMGSDDWEIIAKLPLGDTAEFDFYASDLSPFIVGLPKLFFGPQEFLIEGFLRASRSDDFEFLFFLKHSWFERITGQRDYSQTETEKLKTFNTLRVKRGDKIQVHVSAENVNFDHDGKDEFIVDEKYIKGQKLWQFSTFIDDDDTVCSRKLVLRCTIHHNDTNFQELRLPYYPKRGEQGTKGNQSQAANVMVTGGSTYISRNKNCSNETTVKR